MLKNLVYLAIFTTFVIAVWIGLTIYHNFSTTTISEVAQIQIVPIDATFNPEAIQKLKQRRQVAADLAREVLIASDPEEELEASEEAEINPQLPLQSLTPEDQTPQGDF